MNVPYDSCPQIRSEIHHPPLAPRAVDSDEGVADGVLRQSRLPAKEKGQVVCPQVVRLEQLAEVIVNPLIMRSVAQAVGDCSAGHRGPPTCCGDMAPTQSMHETLQRLSGDARRSTKDYVSPTSQPQSPQEHLPPEGT